MLKRQEVQPIPILFFTCFNFTFICGLSSKNGKMDELPWVFENSHCHQCQKPSSLNFALQTQSNEKISSNPGRIIQHLHSALDHAGGSGMLDKCFPQLRTPMYLKNATGD